MERDGRAWQARERRSLPLPDSFWGVCADEEDGVAEVKTVIYKKIRFLRVFLTLICVSTHILKKNMQIFGFEHSLTIALQQAYPVFPGQFLNLGRSPVLFEILLHRGNF